MIRHRFFTQSDFKENPLRAVAKRILWRLHWYLQPDKPILVRRWWRDMEIMLPHSASAAQVYYRRFSSKAKLETLSELIEPGMTALDVGAHAGEYTLILAELCGKDGFVHAFEPQPELAKIVERNIQRNRQTNARVHQCAVGKQGGEIGFLSDKQSQGGWIAGTAEASFTVPEISLDGFIDSSGISKIGFIKIDAAGYELGVLEGSRRCLEQMRPIIVCQLYHPDVVRARQGYRGDQVFKTLREHGYNLSFFNEEISKETHCTCDYADVLAAFHQSDNYSLSLVALPRNRERFAKWT